MGKSVKKSKHRRIPRKMTNIRTKKQCGFKIDNFCYWCGGNISNKTLTYMKDEDICSKCINEIDDCEKQTIEGKCRECNRIIGHYCNWCNARLSLILIEKMREIKTCYKCL
jgi:hypothetical protein